ncbi:tetratricopeptide repeat protein [Candidatus Spongiihabitans sp.]|uniref:tetratricopeptide repeat protein n=1 Tax=Candidatus Spongiihabitans sp. TaxID=3101308 RepID=UPI003C79F8E5
MIQLSKILRYCILLSAITFVFVPTASSEVLSENMMQSAVIENPSSTNTKRAIDNELRSELLELRSELLDNRADTITWWLEVALVIIAFFAIVIPVVSFFAGLFSYRKFQDFKKEATEILEETKKIKDEVAVLKEGAEEDRRKIAEERKNAAQYNTQGGDGKDAQEIKNAPEESPLDKDSTRDLLSQQIEKSKDTIEQRKATAKAAEESNPEAAADTWFSVGYLFQLKKPTAADHSNNQNALDAYTNAIRLNPNHVEVYFNRGNVNADLGKYENAIRDYTGFIERQPASESGNAQGKITMSRNAHFNRGNACAELQPPNYGEAIVNYNIALDHAIYSTISERGMIYYNQGNAKFSIENYSGAVEDYDNAISCGTYLRDSWFNRGNAEAKLINLEDALKSYDESIKVDANYRPAYSNRAVVKFVLGRVDESLSDINQLAQSEPSGVGDNAIQVAINNGQIIQGSLGRKRLNKKTVDVSLEVIGNVGNIGMFGGTNLPGGKGFAGWPGFSLTVKI